MMGERARTSVRSITATLLPRRDTSHALVCDDSPVAAFPERRVQRSSISILSPGNAICRFSST